MPVDVDVLTGVLLILFCGAMVCSMLSIVAAWSYLSAPRKVASATPNISILKPLSGLDANLEVNLRTFFEQNYPAFEILFAVRTRTDPAVKVVEKLRSEYVGVPSRLLITGEPRYSNAKVFSLSRMMAEAENDLVVMSDSDTSAGPNLLRSIAAEFDDPEIGIATCPYRAVPGASVWSRMEATGMNTDFMAGILVARMVEGMQFAVGPTIAARRSVLGSIGGVDRLKDYLAEDFVMGKFAAEAGHGVILSSYVVEHHIGSSNLRLNAAHRLRWVRSTRRSRPLGYLGQVFTMPLPVALLAVACNFSLWPMIPVAMAIRALAAWTVSVGVLRAPVRWALLPLEDLTAFAFWIAGFFGKTIMWRGQRYRLHPDGRFELAR